MDWEEVRPLLERVLALPADERDAALARECNADESLLARLRALLAAGHERRELFEPLAAPEEPAGRLGAGDRAGPWRLVKLLGEGGMGRVWLAERADSDFQQRVALKLIKHGMDTEAVLRRFRRERRVLADLDHPGLVRLLDGGATEAGQPYLVMELVQGTQLDVHCRERGLALEERLALFARVCDAVEAAHALGVVHRDLKPANVLVTASGEPKVLDFGIAKVLGEEGPEASLLTRTGERLLTPRYAAPEQVRGEECSAATDVYALGVMLYELLCGRPPYELEGVTPRELESTVCEAQPRRPSSFARGTQRTRLAGDLDVICMRSLAKDPARRYLDAGRLARDLRRHLAHEPIEARPDSVRYRAGRFVRRNRLLVGATVAVVTALSIGLALAIWHSLESDRMERLAVARASDAEWSAYCAGIKEYYANLRTHDGNVIAPDTAVASAVSTGAPNLARIGPEELRGWEWRHLLARSDVSRRVLHRAQGNTRLLMDRAGTRLAFYEGGELVLLDTATSELSSRTTLGKARRPALSEDATLVAFGAGLELRLLEIPSGEERARWEIGGAVERIRFVPGGRLLAVADSRAITLFALDDHAFRREVAPWKTRDLVVAPDGSWLAGATREGMVHVFGIEDPTLDAHFPLLDRSNLVVALAVSGSGDYLAAASDEGIARIWSLATRQPVSLPLHTNSYCTSIAFRADRDELIVAADNPIVWNVASGRSRVLHGTGMTVQDLVAHPSEPRFYTSTNDGRILEWRADAEPVPVHHVVSGSVEHVSASPDGARYAAASGSATNRVVLIETASGRVLTRRDASVGAIHDLLHAPSGELLCASDGAVRVLDGHDLRTLAEIEVEQPSCLAITPDGSTLLVGTRDGRVLGIAIRERSVVSELRSPLAEVAALVVHPDGRRATLIGSGEADACELELERGLFRVHAARTDGEALSVAASPDGALIAIGGKRGFQVRSTSDGAVLFADDKKNAKGVLFTPDGLRLLAANDGQVRVYDTRRWTLVVSFKENARGIQDMDLAPDGTLLTADYAGDVRVLRVKAPAD